MKIYFPMVFVHITQGFGENKACINEKTGKVYGKSSGLCPIGTVDFYKSMGMLGHNGIDFSMVYSGQPIFHCVDFLGWSKSEIDGAGGIGVDIISYVPLIDCPSCGEKHYVKARYWHNKQILKADKTSVALGDKICLGDNTGASSGSHLHFGLKFCDKNGDGIHYDNGYYGCFDPTPYLSQKFVIEGMLGRDLGCVEKVKYLF